MQGIKVLIAEDITPIRNLYSSILEKTPDIELVAAVKSGQEAVAQTILTRPDVILMDIEMEEPDAGLYAAKEILNQFPDIKIIILTVYEDDDMVFAAFQLGICDYILKNASNDEIVKAIRDAYNGMSPIRPEIASKIRIEFQRVKQYESSFLYTIHIVSSLTPVEFDMLKLLAAKKTRKQICEERSVEMSTVKSQIRTILRKFGKTQISEVLADKEAMNVINLIAKSRGKYI